MIVSAVPARGPFTGSVAAPPSKSHTNRALILAALSEQPVEIVRPLACDDLDAMVGCLSAAGVRIDRAGDGLVVSPGAPPGGEATLDVRESGTACRFLTAFAAATPGLRAFLTGSDRLRERPVGPLVDALRILGAEIDYLGRPGFPPLSIRGRRLRGGPIEVDASASSQFASALLLVAPRLADGIALTLAGPAVSRAYLDTTRETLEAAGIRSSGGSGTFTVPAGQAVTAGRLAIPGDYSSAASLAAAVAVAGGGRTIENLPWPSSQADAAALDVLEAMGVAVERSSGAITVSGRARRAVAVDAADFPDAVPVLCAAAAGVDGETVITGIEHLRLKESDRIAAIEDLLRAAGARAQFESGVLRVAGPRGPSLVPAFLPTRSDHRIVMAAALLALSSGGFVEAPRAVEKSYPGFFRDLIPVSAVV
jgi:3-phosphoshikimate 1-carboxyvinyltransferase